MSRYKPDENEQLRIQKMNKEQLTSELKKLTSQANRNLTNLRKHGFTYGAYRVAMENGGRFTTEGKSFNQLRAEYYRVQTFLNSATSTVSGVRAERRKIENRIGTGLSQEQWKDFWTTYHKLSEMDEFKLAINSRGSDRLQTFLYEQFNKTNGDWEQILETGMDYVNNQYSEFVKVGNENDRFSDQFFEDYS